MTQKGLMAVHKTLTEEVENEEGGSSRYRTGPAHGSGNGSDGDVTSEIQSSALMSSINSEDSVDISEESAKQRQQREREKEIGSKQAIGAILNRKKLSHAPSN